MSWWRVAFVMLFLLACLLLVGTIDYNALGLP